MPVRLKTALQLGTLFTLVLAISVSLMLAFVLFRGTAETNTTVASLVTISLGILALVMAGALYMVGTAITDRLRRLEEAARQVGAGQLNLAVQMDGRDELAEIALVFDEMLSNLRNYVELIPAHQHLQEELTKMQAVVGNLRNRNMEISDSLQRLRRAQDQLMQKQHTDMLGKMFATVSCDFMSALTSIRQVAEKVLASADRTQPSALPLEAICATAADAQDKLRSLTAFCETRKPSAAEAVDLRTAVQEAIGLAEHKRKEATGGLGPGIRIGNKLGSLPAVRGNAADLVQMFTHLIFNAVEAMPGGGEIGFTAESRPDAVTIAVTDSGVGMTESALKRCFLPFFSTKEGAAGIGLSLAQGIVQQHDGKIGIESHVGAGTTVYIELPRTAARQRSAAEIPPPPIPPISVLLVEDDPWTRDAIVQHLVAHQHRIVTAGNGAMAIEKLQQAAFDVVLTDRAMPDISGEEIAIEAKRLRPGVPVVMLTGFGSLMREKGEKPLHVDVVLGKPIAADDLLRALADLTRADRTERAKASI